MTSSGSSPMILPPSTSWTSSGVGGWSHRRNAESDDSAMAVPSSERRRSAYFRPTTEILLTLFLATASASHPRPSPRSECRQPPPNNSGSLTDGLLGRYASEKRLTGNGFAVQVVEDVGGGGHYITDHTQ